MGVIPLKTPCYVKNLNGHFETTLVFFGWDWVSRKLFHVISII